MPLFIVCQRLGINFWKTNRFIAPAREALQYEQKKFLLAFQESPFAGDPRPELDRAWHELLEPINIRVSSEDLRINNLTSVDLPGNKGSLAQLGVWHELHCIVCAISPASQSVTQ